MRRSIDSHLLLLAIDKYDHSASNYHQRHMMEWTDMDADGSYCFRGKILHQSGRYASQLFPRLAHRSFLSGCVFLKSAELSALFFFSPPPLCWFFFRDFHVFLSSLFSSLVNHSSIDSALDENITENIYNFATNEIVREKYIIFKLIFCKLFQYRISSNWKVSIIKSRVKPRIIFNFVEIRFLSAFDLSWFIK